MRVSDSSVGGEAGQFRALCDVIAAAKDGCSSEY